MYLLFGTLFPALLFFCCLNYWRRKKIICKVRSMCMEEKCSLLNDIIAPFGYSYLPAQDIFTSRTDAWQREFGYCGLYDDAAVFLHMVFDALPIYFNYCGRTWLIELWKGQYGINTGCEIGIYHANRILAEEERRHTVFQCAEDENMPEISLAFSSAADGSGQNSGAIAKLRAKHWWLTAFRMGCFSNPSNLSLRTSICLYTPEMAEAFVRGLLGAGYNRVEIRRRHRTVTFDFAEACTESSLCRPKHGRLYRLAVWVIQWENWFWCKIYLWVTRPFDLTVDRILYLYYYLPFAFRRMLRLKRFKKHRRGRL